MRQCWVMRVAVKVARSAAITSVGSSMVAAAAVSAEVSGARAVSPVFVCS